jgi:phage terminase large subunit
VLGEFPQEGTDTLIHLGWVDKCRENTEPEEDDAIKIVACDVARYGEDKTAIIDRVGHTIEKLEVREKIPTTMTSGIVKRHYEAESADCLVVDDSGVGGGVTDTLVSQRIGVLPFNGGSKQRAIDKNRFRNLRSQFYWIMARKCERGLYNLSKLPQKEYEILKSQLCSIKYEVDVEGRICIETKDDMKARGLNSPDLSDCLMMSEYAFFMGHHSEIKPYSYR